MGKVLNLAALAKVGDPALRLYQEVSLGQEYDTSAGVHREHLDRFPTELKVGFSDPRRSCGPPLGLSVLRNVFVSPRGAIITESGNLISESCFPYHGKGLEKPFGDDFNIVNDDVEFSPTNLSVEENQLYFLREHGENGFFHWMHSVWPRLMLLQGATLASGFKIFCSVKARFQRESLQLSGTSLEKIRTVNQGEWVLARELVYPRPFVELGDFWARPPQILSFFDSINLPQQPERLRIFISRSPTTARAIINEAELSAALEERGFLPVRLEELSFSDQAAMMRGSDFVIGAHGAGLSHVAFMRPGSKVLEILSPKRFWQTFRAISGRRGLQYGFAVGEDIKAPNPDANSPFEVNVSKVISVVDEMLA